MMSTTTKLLFANLRLYARHRGRRGPISRLVRSAARFHHSILSVLTASDIELGACIGRRVAIPHPCGLVIHRDVVIGDGCFIMQQVTIGLIDSSAPPRIGDGVYIGAGARILGPIRIGDDARVGANAVVLKDVPANATVVGVPARVVRMRPKHGEAESVF